MIRLKQSDERGAVALITAVVISILLTIIVVALVTLMSSELRQANDAEQSTRAYYAAQSGIEDGVHHVVSQLALGQPPDQGCGSEVDIAPLVGWTCQRITSSGSPKGKLNSPDQAEQYDLSGSSFDSLELAWDTTNGSISKPPFYNFPTVAPLPASGAWSGAAAMELTVVSYPLSGVTQANIVTKNVLAIPHNGGVASIPNVGGVLNANPYQAKCIPGTVVGQTYHCRITLTGFDTTNFGYIIRARSRYSGTDYQLQFLKAGVVQSVPEGSATIDVTAKAGDVFRRVIYKVPYKNSAAAGLNFVLFSDNNICKDYSLIGGLIGGGYPCGLN